MNQQVEIKIKKLHEAAIIPMYATPGSGCFDLHALIQHVHVSETQISVPGDPVHVAGEPIIFRTGLAMEIPPGYVLEIYSRSGHGFKNNVRLSNCVGIIDSDYRGEIMVKMVQDTDAGAEMVVRHGDRIAQAKLVVAPKVGFTLVEDLGETERGTGGFGSTGTSL